MHIRNALVAALIAVGITGQLTFAATTEPATQPATQPLNASAEGDHLSVTESHIKIGNTDVPYRATAGTMLLKDEAGKPKADLFFVAYEKTGLDDAQRDARPVTFVFNGGPGAASVWLHLGTAGPMRISVPEDGMPPAPPFKLVENPDSWLDVTDLVFIDPVGTGYSRPTAGEAPNQFYGVEEDIQWVADFIRLYTTRYERWPSPKFLAGESYGTTRAAALSEYLIDQHGLALNGIVLISSVLDFQTIQPGKGNDLPYPLYLPTYVALAARHGKLEPAMRDNLDKTIEEARAWATDVYLPALVKGHALSAEERAAIVDRLAHYTGLPAKRIEASDLRIDPSQFQKELLGEERKIIGRFDGQVTAFDPSPEASWPSIDPSLSGFLPAYSSTFNDYVRRTLGFRSDLHYEVLSGKVQPWNFGHGGNGYVFVADNLSSAMVKNPHLQVFFASGYYDLATPFLVTEYTVNQLDISAELRKNIVQKHYLGGHMMYHVAKIRTQLKSDISEFIERSMK